MTIYKIGFYTGLCWSASFLLAMLSLSQPAFGLAGNIVGIGSVFVAGWLLRISQMEEEGGPVSWAVHLRWRRSLQVQLLAALLCLFVQVMYFRYIDNGHFLASVTQMYTQPQYADMLKQMLPERNPNEIVEAFSDITLNQLALNFMVVNSFFAIILSLPTAWVARVKGK